MTIRVLVADDHAAIRVGLVMILDGAEGVEVVGEAGTAPRRSGWRGRCARTWS